MTTREFIDTQLSEPYRSKALANMDKLKLYHEWQPRTLAEAVTHMFC